MKTLLCAAMMLIASLATKAQTRYFSYSQHPSLPSLSFVCHGNALPMLSCSSGQTTPMYAMVPGSYVTLDASASGVWIPGAPTGTQFAWVDIMQTGIPFLTTYLFCGLSPAMNLPVDFNGTLFCYVDITVTPSTTTLYFHP